MAKLMGKAVIAQGGGPTAVINQSLAGVIFQVQRHNHISDLYGAIHGVRGIIEENFIDLGRISSRNIEDVAVTPGAALGSTRDKPDQEYCQKIFEVFKKHDIRYFFYIGGNDSADTCRIVNEQSNIHNYDLRVFHIPKTIDNDLLVTDHTPGYPSAAKFVAQAFTGVNLDNRSIPGVYIGVVMGRHAGFLTAAAGLAKKYSEDGPHLIYLPEKPFSIERFLHDVEKVISQQGRCVIAVSEGIVDDQGNPMMVKLQERVEHDSHGNVQLSGTGMLGDALKDLIKENLKVKRVRGDTFGYLQRSFLGCTSQVDAWEAREIAEYAVNISSSIEADGSITMHRTGDYSIQYQLTSLTEVAKKTKSMPDQFIDAENSFITTQFVNYLKPLVGELPNWAKLSAPKINVQY